MLVQGEEEIKELKKQSLVGSRFRMVTVGLGFLSFPLLVFFIKLKIDLILRLVLIFSLYFIFIFIFSLLFKRQTKKKKIENLNFIHIVIDFIFLMFLVHYGGGLSWVLVFSCLGSLTYTYIVLPRKDSMIVTIFLLSMITGLGFFEYFGILPHRSVFTPDPYNNFNYFLTTILVLWGLIISVSVTLNFFAGSLRRQSELLEGEYKEDEDIREGLEVQVGARKQELTEIAKNLDKEVLNKKKELDKRMQELEEVNQRTIKRELRMIELKKEIKKMEKDLSNK